jgi:hypothetical protein
VLGINSVNDHGNDIVSSDFGGIMGERPGKVGKTDLMNFAKK